MLKNKIAIAHARPEEGANRLGVSLLMNKKKIKFEDNVGIHFLFILSSTNPKAHLQILKDISSWTSEEVDLGILLDKDPVEVVNYAKKITGKIQR